MAKLRGHQDLAEICRRSRLDPNHFRQDRHLDRRHIPQTEALVALAEWRQLAA